MSGSPVAIVTGASRGVGKGVAVALATAGYRVFAAGRSVAKTAFDGDVRAIPCDVTNEGSVASLFEHAWTEAGRLDVVAHCAWGGYERMVDGGRFTWPDPFWQQPSWRWTSMVDVAVKGGFLVSQQAARRMVPARAGLIAHISTWAAKKHIGNAIYGVAKAATDKLAEDMAHELRPHGVAVVSLYPGLVRTEAVLAAGVFDLSNSESPEFTGRAVAALAGDPDVLRRSGSTLVVAALAEEYGFADIDGRQPRPLTLADV
jgi:NAD(P)-dependent dehydrogenase (short-subunit alcohol dehydrogenase family)